LEPATFGVTGRRSKPTELRPRGRVRELNRPPSQVKAGARKGRWHRQNRQTRRSLVPIWARQWLISAAGHCKNPDFSRISHGQTPSESSNATVCRVVFDATFKRGGPAMAVKKPGAPATV